MGFYIEPPQATGKARQLVELYGAKDVGLPPRSFSEVPFDQMLICVVENDIFDAAGICFDAEEFSRMQEVNTGRRRTWLYMSKEKIAELKPQLRPFILGHQGWRDK